MTRVRRLGCCALILLLGLSTTTARALDEPGPAVVRLNQVQVIGSHNSYHIAPDPAVMGLIAATQPRLARSLAYTHPPLAEQFSKQGIRQIELDTFADPEGGLYASPRSLATLKALRKEPAAPHDPEGLMKRPGMKVLHVPDIDFRSTTPTLLDALRQVRVWSKAHPRHVPIFVLLELKAQGVPAWTKPVPFDAKVLDALDAEIRSVFKPEDMITPDDIRGRAATLPDALRAHGWPPLDDARGKVMFALDNEDKVRDTYLEGHPAGAGRPLFVSVAEGHPAAAWFKVNDVLKDFDRIQRLVKAGYLVRTRADTDTIEARANDPGRRDRALASGAQFVSTDYAEADPTLSPYRVRLPGGVVARPNPVSGNPRAEGVDLEADAPTHPAPARGLPR